MYKQDLTLNNPEGLICHKTQPTIKSKLSLFLYQHFFKIYHFSI